VAVEGTDQVTFTDVDGRYVLNLAPGQHTLRVALDGYQERVVTLNLQAGQGVVSADVGLSMNAFAETVTVTAQAVDAATSSLAAQTTLRRNAAVITDNLGGQEMSANGDGNAAAAMQRVTGLSVVDDFVFVRGLGERYSNTTLNGAVIPTTEPDRKVVGLDLFPSGLIDSVQVSKSYSPDLSAEFAGGLVQIEPLKLPTGPTVDFSYSLGFNSATTGQDILGYTGGGRDWLGFDDGTRALPASIPNRKVIRGGRFTPNVGLLRSELETLGEAFDNGQWTPTTATGKPNQSVSTVLGNRFGKAGLILSFTQSYSQQFTEENQIYFVQGAAGLEEFSNYDFRTSSMRANTGMVANVAYQFSPTQRLSLENFYTHNGRDEARTYEGFNDDIATNIRNTRVYWIEEDLLSNTLSGEHFFQNARNSTFDWRVSYAAANRDEPDLREALYEQNGDEFVLSDESQSGFRMFNALDDTTLDVGLNWSTFGTQWSDLPMQFKVGLNYVEREREFVSRRFRYVPIAGIGDANLFPGTMDLTDTPEELFTPGNIGQFWEFREETRTTDTYDANQEVLAFYAMIDLSLTPRTRLVTGARVEQFDQQVNTFDLFDFEGDPDIIPARIEETDIFPAVNLVQALTPQTNLRISYSQTVNRPEFRELAPFEFTDVVGGRATVGNPDLDRALIQNFDVRFEAFPTGDEVLAASVFYKHFADPIERVVEPTAQLRTSFANADSASNVGLELEARRRVHDNLLVGANYTFVDSSITLPADRAALLTSNERALAGQSKNLFNAMAEVSNGTVSARMLYNFFGARISDVGSLGIPDIYEDGRGALDLVVSARWRMLNIKLSAENLTDEAFTFTQGGLDQRAFKTGRTFGVSFGLAAF
jgi:TonB-dependent receptor